MDFVEQLQSLALKSEKLRSVLQTEEATKNALVLPFIHLLGYDIFDPNDVVPEFIADVGIKKGEKVDYAVKLDGKIVMLFECKHCAADLNVSHASQLFRYFAVTDARVAILTNGIVYRFYTDLDAPNRMDDKPFLDVNMLDLNDVAITELKKMRKENFDLEGIISSASELKYTRQIKRIINSQIETPSDDFVRFFATKVYDGVLTPARRSLFNELTRKGFQQLINERINERLKNVMSGDVATDVDGIETTEVVTDIDVQTTAEELEGFYIVKALLRDMVDPFRIVHRDTKSYMGILLDNNNRKPLARLHFNRSQKYLGIFNEQRTEERVPIRNLDDIYKYADQMRRVFSFYESEAATESQNEPVAE